MQTVDSIVQLISDNLLTVGSIVGTVLTLGGCG